jgi:hypothetical protein
MFMANSKSNNRELGSIHYHLSANIMAAAVRQTDKVSN